MKDTIIKGTKNSRSIIGAASIPATWEQARAQLIQSGWPIDLGPLNAAGLTQKGDDLNKANLLKDATAALYGLTAAAVPDQVLAKAINLITAAQNTANTKGNLFIETGTYTGKYTSGSTGALTLTFSHNPLIVCISILISNDGIPSGIQAVSRIILNDAYGLVFLRNGSFGIYSNDSISGKTLTITHGNPHYDMDYAGITYRYYALGI